MGSTSLLPVGKKGGPDLGRRIGAALRPLFDICALSFGLCTRIAFLLRNVRLKADSGPCVCLRKIRVCIVKQENIQTFISPSDAASHSGQTTTCARMGTDDRKCTGQPFLGHLIKAN